MRSLYISTKRLVLCYSMHTEKLLRVRRKEKNYVN